MNQEPSPPVSAMPKVVDVFLTNKVLCALLAVMMLTSAYWFNMLFGNLRMIAFFFLLAGVLLHLAVPSLFALVSLGGGLKYSLQVGGIAAILLLVLSSGSLYTAAVFMLLFVILSTLAAQVMQQKGLGQAGWILALVIFFGIVFAMMVSAGQLDVETFVHQQFQPVFDTMIARIPPGAKSDIIAMQGLQSMMVKVFPGFFVFGLWMIWWSDLIFARKVAQRYGFYHGEEKDVLSFSLPKTLVFVLLIFLGFANLATGNLQYLALSGVMMLAGMLAVQGVIVVHAWLKSKAMTGAILVMYVMLFFWSVIVIIFAFIGLFDIWFNFRRTFMSATGEK